MEINSQNSDDQTEDVSDDFILADTYCAVAPDESSPENVWFIKVKDSFESAAKIITDYKNVTTCGLRYIEVSFTGKVVLANDFCINYLRKKNILF